MLASKSSNFSGLFAKAGDFIYFYGKQSKSNTLQLITVEKKLISCKDKFLIFYCVCTTTNSWMIDDICI